MFVATGALILPAAFEAALPEDASTQAGVLALSRGTSIILLIIYILFLVYQLKTHAHVFESEGLYPDESTLQADAPISPWATGTTLLLATVAVSFCSDYLVGSVDDVVESFNISKTFIGLVLVPIVGNAGIFSPGVAYGNSGDCDMCQAWIQNEDGSCGGHYTRFMHANSLVFDSLARSPRMGLWHPDES